MRLVISKMIIFYESAIIEEKLKTVKFKGAQWQVEFAPSVASIARMKLMSAAHPRRANL